MIRPSAVAIFGVKSAITRAEVVRRSLAGVALLSVGSTTAIFQTDPGICIPFAIVLPLNSDGPVMIKTSFPPAASERVYVSKVAHNPWLLFACWGMILLMRKVCLLSSKLVVRSAEGHI